MPRMRRRVDARESNVERTSIARGRVVFSGKRAFLAYPAGLVTALSGPPIASRRFEAQHTLLYEVPNIECRSENQQFARRDPLLCRKRNEDSWSVQSIRSAWPHFV